jgi:hypothetical protein
MVTRPAYVWSGSDWDEIGDARLGSSVTALETQLGSKLDLAGGKVLQIVRATDSTRRSTTSTSFVDVTGLSVTITPNVATSALIIILSAAMDSGLATGDGLFQITDSSNNSLNGAQLAILSKDAALAMQTLFGYSTPASASALTYKARFRTGTSGSFDFRGDLVTSQLYAIEVSA